MEGAWETDETANIRGLYYMRWLPQYGRTQIEWKQKAGGELQRAESSGYGEVYPELMTAPQGSMTYEYMATSKLNNVACFLGERRADRDDKSYYTVSYTHLTWSRLFLEVIIITCGVIVHVQTIRNHTRVPRRRMKDQLEITNNRDRDEQRAYCTVQGTLRMMRVLASY